MLDDLLQVPLQQLATHLHKLGGVALRLHGVLVGAGGDKVAAMRGCKQVGKRLCIQRCIHNQAVNAAKSHHKVVESASHGKALVVLWLLVTGEVGGRHDLVRHVAARHAGDDALLNFLHRV